jgi:hypothetical protein
VRGFGEAKQEGPLRVSLQTYRIDFMNEDSIEIAMYGPKILSCMCVDFVMNG